MRCRSKQDLRNHPAVAEFWKVDGHYFVELGEGWYNRYSREGLLKATNVFGLCDLMQFTREVHAEPQRVTGKITNE